MPDYQNTYTYNDQGQLTQIIQSGVSGGNMVAEKEIDLTYNADGTFNSITRMLGSQTVVTGTYTFDELSRLTGLVYSQGSTTLSSYALTYSDTTTASSFASTMPSGGMWVPGQNIISPVPDTADIPYALENSASAPGGLVSTVTSSDGQVQYSYDAEGQLIGATYTGTGSGATAGSSSSALPANESYSYDANGNRTGATAGSSSSVYTVDPNNEVLSDGTYNYSYDAEGNVTERTDIATGAVTDYTWDARDRLTEVTDKDGSGNITQTVSLYYDADNRWIGETVTANGQTQETAFAYDGNQIVLQFDGDGSPLSSGEGQGEGGSASALTVNDLSHRYLWGPAVDQILADERVTQSNGQATTQEVLFPLADQLGSVRDVAKLSGGSTSIVDHIEYNSYGKAMSESDPSQGCIVGFGGLLYDRATQLNVAVERVYDAVLGRWLSQDPSDIAGGGDANLRRYCGNSPTNATDPSGLAPPYRTNFTSVTPAMPQDWAVHHVAQQAEVLAERYSRELGVDVHALPNLRGVPQDVHKEINYLQRQFWIAQGKKYNCTPEQAMSKTPISEIQQLNATIQEVYGGLMVEAGASSAEIAAVQARLASSGLSTAGKVARFKSVLSQINVSLGIVAIFAVFAQNAVLAKNIESPPPYVQSAWNDFLTSYGAALSQAMETGQVSAQKWDIVGEKLQEYMAAAGFDNTLRGEIRIGWERERLELN